ncbi:hypothetical protein FUB07_07415 [Vibrio cholerae]|nr:hypothetical protein [Vibrio cholerae]
MLLEHPHFSLCKKFLIAFLSNESGARTLCTQPIQLPRFTKVLMMNKSINMQRFYFIVRDSGKFNKMLHYLR